MKLWRFLLAAALAPATGPIIYCVGMLVGSGYPYSGPGHMEKLLDIVLVFMAISYPVSIGLGALIVGALYFRHGLAGLNCIGWALPAGAAAGVIFLWSVESPGYESSTSIKLIVCAVSAVIGGLTALTFCLIAGLKMKQPADMPGRVEDSTAV
ncbi:hypothetical protein [Mesorhizobium sp. 131-2-1]|uniref:hypothetical protein n=1 Tax=Mesorhizobium sp. 131-2-1 TaxID=2744518 RepID=UPI00192912A5|nr:hypothetical protein [Mesorhizobium sp. 131-2-1]BCG95595.1 hypothetical protein MesoLj131a_44590 [Mesorhizobium sp. 131-2-1]